MELFEFLGSPKMDSTDELELLQHMNKLAVRSKNIAVHRNEFYSMKQDGGQTIQQFVAKLRAKAEHCDFTLKCHNCNESSSYMSSMVADRMVIGCYDGDILNEVLARDDQLNNFDDKFKLMQALESGKHARSQLGSESSMAAQKSSYQRTKKKTNPNYLKKPTQSMLRLW